MAEAKVGQGNLFLLGPEVTNRGQPHGTFKLLFNGIYLAGAKERTRTPISCPYSPSSMLAPDSVVPFECCARVSTVLETRVDDFDVRSAVVVGGSRALVWDTLAHPDQMRPDRPCSPGWRRWWRTVTGTGTTYRARGRWARWSGHRSRGLRRALAG